MFLHPFNDAASNTTNTGKNEMIVEITFHRRRFCFIHTRNYDIFKLNAQRFNDINWHRKTAGGKQEDYIKKTR